MSYIKKNKASSISIIVAAFISTMFLSLISCLFYNMWQYDMDLIITQEGDWQGRLIGSISDHDIEMIKQFANVEHVTVYDDSSDGTVTIDVYFENMRDIYEDLPLIADKITVSSISVQYHESLLSQYLIFDPQDEQPPLLLLFYVVVLSIASISLILIIRNAFSVSMNARIHQFGIFSSIGATPGQIKKCLLQEASVLCILPIIIGSIAGIGLCALFVVYANYIADEYQSIPAVLQYHVGIWIITIVVSCLTVFLSAWFPARRLSRMSPLEAIRLSEQQLKRKKHSRILSFLFGIEGELAGNSLKARKTALRTTTLSLTLSFLAYTIFVCFITLSSISVKHTYFERYKDSWDIMVTVKDTAIADVKGLEELRGLENIESSVAYQKATAYTTIHAVQQSEELLAIGGISSLDSEALSVDGDDYLVKLQLIIIDDKSFEEYCKQIGIETQPEGGILINRIWNSVNSNFRYKEYIPFLKETETHLAIKNNEGDSLAEIPVIGYTSQMPVLREEYENYALVQVIPVSVWSSISEKVETDEPDTFLRIFTMEDSSLNDDMAVVSKHFENRNKIEIENRVQEELTNEEIQTGYMIIVGSLCVLLAVIGIANIFSNMLGSIYQRKREFARYLSVGVTPNGIWKILILEALSIAGRPLFITLPLTILFIVFAVTESNLDPKEFVAQMPIIPIMMFIILIFFFVGLAYYIGGRIIEKCKLSETLRDDTMI